MKILVLSLLRLGDLLMHQEILDDLQKIYPGSLIDLVINDSSSAAQNLIRGVNKIYVFPRKQIQDNLVLREGSFFRAYRQLKQCSQEIQTQDYEMVIDLTHTLFSKALLGALKIPEAPKPKKQFINDIFVDSARSTFHYLDALKQSQNILTTTQIPTIKLSAKNYLVIQPLTNDRKKNWPLHSYQSLIRKIHSLMPEKQILIVGSPSESVTLKTYFPENAFLKVNICDLSTLQQILESAEFLISGDTATVHLAAQTRTPMLGLYLGSAEPTKTAPRIQGAWILQSNEACVPCRHSDPCKHEEHLCAASLTAHSVFEVLQAIWTKNENELKRIAWNSSFSIQRTRINNIGQFEIEDLSLSDALVGNQIRQRAFLKIYQQKDFSIESLLETHQGELWELSLFVSDRLKNIQRVHEIIVDIQDEVRKISKSCLRLDLQVDGHLQQLRPLIREFSVLSDDSEWSPCLEVALKNSWEESSFVVYRRWRALIDNLSSFYEIQNESLQNLQSLLRERGVYYVPGPTRAT